MHCLFSSSICLNYKIYLLLRIIRYFCEKSNCFKWRLLQVFHANERNDILHLLRFTFLSLQRNIYHRSQSEFQLYLVKAESHAELRLTFFESIKCAWLQSWKSPRKFCPHRNKLSLRMNRTKWTFSRRASKPCTFLPFHLPLSIRVSIIFSHVCFWPKQKTAEYPRIEIEKLPETKGER